MSSFGYPHLRVNHSVEFKLKLETGAPETRLKRRLNEDLNPTIVGVNLTRTKQNIFGGAEATAS